VTTLPGFIIAEAKKEAAPGVTSNYHAFKGTTRYGTGESANAEAWIAKFRPFVIPNSSLDICPLSMSRTKLSYSFKSRADSAS
jgi:hypothetical protein